MLGSHRRNGVSAQHRYKLRLRTDWFRIMVDLERAQYPTPRVSKVIDVPLNTLRGWKYGSEPAHNYGLVLLELW